MKRQVLTKHASFKDVRSYDCADYDFKTNQKQYLKAHVLLKHNATIGRAFQCQQCDYKST